MVHEIGEIFRKGGWGMWPILGHLVFILAIMFERIFVLYLRSSLNKDEFIKMLQVPILKGDLNKVVKICSTTPYPLARIDRKSTRLNSSH